MKLTGSCREGVPVTAKQQAFALSLWFDESVRYRGYRLASILNLVCKNWPDDKPWPHSRNADALLQKLRKAGVIEFIEGWWYLTDAYADSILEDVHEWAND